MISDEDIEIASEEIIFTCREALAAYDMKLLKLFRLWLVKNGIDNVFYTDSLIKQFLENIILKESAR